VANFELQTFEQWEHNSLQKTLLEGRNGLQVAPNLLERLKRRVEEGCSQMEKHVEFYFDLDICFAGYKSWCHSYCKEKWLSRTRDLLLSRLRNARLGLLLPVPHILIVEDDIKAAEDAENTARNGKGKPSTTA
jgi:hypothetical protein